MKKFFKSNTAIFVLSAIVSSTLYCLIYGRDTSNWLVVALVLQAILCAVFELKDFIKKNK